jgi:uncharacterized coiled-coil protein SlyX
MNQFNNLEGLPDAGPSTPDGRTMNDMWDTIQSLRQSLNQVTQDRQMNNHLQEQVQQLQSLVRQLENSNVPTPSGTTPVPHGPAVPHREKPRLPDVQTFDKGSHEEYTQWKMQVTAKLFADRKAYPTEEDEVHYIITRTKGLAFTSLRSYVARMMSGEAPNRTDLWACLDGFFLDPSVREKALHFLRNTKQGNGDFNTHVQTFNLKFIEAGMDDAESYYKIDYLKNSLSKKLLRYQAGFQASPNETYDDFVRRMRVTWENLKAIDHPSYDPVPPPSATTTNAPRVLEDTMDWTPTIGGAVRPRTREFWGTLSQVQERRDKGLCLRCGRQGHRVASCQIDISKKLARPNRNERTTRVAAATRMNEDPNDSDEGKEEP